tara:strand:- start:526 stop:894 length:369 start_codon:yes stop_codon:yes gene_type:complete
MMSASSIQAKVKKGLAKAIAATGSPTSEPVYLVVKTQAGTPLAPSVTESTTLLVNAIFKSYDKFLTDINIQAGDRQLVSNSDVTVSQNDIIRQGLTDYIVVAVDARIPASEALVYISQCRQQ